MSETSQRVGKRILIADDDRNFRTFLRTMLEEAGYQVVEADDGIKAMLRIMDDSPDLVLLDLAMPTITGYRVTELMNSVPDIANIPLIIISGNALMGKAKLEIIGARAVFPKPFDKDDLLETIHGILASSTLEIIEEKPEQPTAAERPAPTEAPPGPARDERDWFGPMRQGTPEETVRTLRQALQAHPEDRETAGRLKLAESLIVRNFFCRFETPADVVPRLDPKLADELTRLSLDPAEGFLLSQMDGQTDLGTLFFVSGMDRFHTCLLLEKLLGQGIVQLASGRTADA